MNRECFLYHQETMRFQKAMEDLEDDICGGLHTNCIKALNHAFKQTTLAKFTDAMTAVKFTIPQLANEETRCVVPVIRKRQWKIAQQKYVQVAYGNQALCITFNSKGKLINLTKNIAFHVHKKKIKVVVSKSGKGKLTWNDGVNKTRKNASMTFTRSGVLD